MKKNSTIRILALAVALLMALMTLVSCDAAGDSYAENVSPSIDAADRDTAGGMEGGSADGTVGSLSGDYDRKIIRTVTMSCETKAYDDAITLIITALQTHGGYVETSETTGTGYESVRNSERRATYTLRVPAEKLDAFLETLRSNDGIRILSQNATSSEITAAYYDTVSRLETLEAEKTSLTVMLEGFTDYSDINAMLRVQERLYDVIEEIESLQTKLNIYDGQVAMSTVKLSLREVITYTEVVEPDPTFGQRIKTAFSKSWADFGRGCQNFAVWFVGAFPPLLVVVSIYAAIFFIIYGSIKRRNRKRAARAAVTVANKTEGK
ncbi:MAG: DUF4349 domain-containing protein [Clostridia bacterium]|nr:DUF4349 domain-containing protein [Clostridia bacterium]